MYCEYCHRIDGHHYKCPNYTPQKATHYCSICDNGIYEGDEYLVNDDNEYAHFDCVEYGKDMAKFLGYKIKEMDEDNYD